MSLRFSGFVLLPLIFVLLTSCTSKLDADAPLSVSNTRGVTVVNGVEVAYTYDGQFYVLAEDMLFYSLEDLRSYIAHPFGSEGNPGTLQAPEEALESFLVPGRQ